jgi:hypothetical protein
MPEVRVQIIEFIPGGYDDFLIVELMDAFGTVHRFEDKVPIFGCEVDVDKSTPLPIPGTFDCVIVERFHSNDRELIRIDTEKPWDIEALAGGYQFVVAPEMVIE